MFVCGVLFIDLFLGFLRVANKLESKGSDFGKVKTIEFTFRPGRTPGSSTKRPEGLPCDRRGIEVSEGKKSEGGNNLRDGASSTARDNW